MGSTGKRGKKLPPVNGARKGTWPVVGCRIRPDDLKVIDRAAAELGIKRSELLLDAALAKARAVLGRAA